MPALLLPIEFTRCDLNSREEARRGVLRWRTRSAKIPVMATMAEEASAAICQAGIAQPRLDRKPKKHPRYHVLLLDDDDHTYEYVVGMLRKLFGHTENGAYQLACEVDSSGRVILDTTSLERAEFKRDQIHAFGRDWRIDRCAGSMTATIEPAPAS